MTNRGSTSRATRVLITLIFDGALWANHNKVTRLNLYSSRSVELCDCWRTRYKTRNFPWSRQYNLKVLTDAIDFTSSGNVVLVGYRLWMPKTKSLPYNVTAKLFQGNTTIAAAQSGNDYSRFSAETFEVRFPQEVFLQANVSYTAMVEITNWNGQTPRNRKLSNNLCAGVNFTFKKSSRVQGRFDSYVRQIPALIFLSSRC